MKEQKIWSVYSLPSWACGIHNNRNRHKGHFRSQTNIAVKLYYYCLQWKLLLRSQSLFHFSKVIEARQGVEEWNSFIFHENLLWIDERTIWRYIWATRHHSNHVIVFLPLKKIKAQWRTGKKSPKAMFRYHIKSCSFKIVNKSAPALIWCGRIRFELLLMLI